MGYILDKHSTQTMKEQGGYPISQTSLYIYKITKFEMSDTLFNIDHICRPSLMLYYGTDAWTARACTGLNFILF